METRRSHLRGWLLAGALSIGALLLSAPSEAHTCSSACNQIRRACVASANATRSAARATCKESEAGCRALCQDDPAICPGPQCDPCLLICEEQSELCRSDAETARTSARVSCEAARTSCTGVCVDPIDGACVQACRSETQRECVRPAKSDEVQCKRSCPGGPANRSCVQSCKRDFLVDRSDCADDEALCVGVCIGLPPGP